MEKAHIAYMMINIHDLGRVPDRGGIRGASLISVPISLSNVVWGSFTIVIRGLAKWVRPMVVL